VTFYPARSTGSCLSASRLDAGSVAPCGAPLAELSQGQGPRALFSAGAPPDALGVGSLAPTKIGPDTSCHELMSTLTGAASADVRDRGPHELAGGRRERHPREGCFTRPSAKRAEIRAPEVPFIDGQLRRAGSSGPQVVTNLWSNRVRRLFDRRKLPGALTSP
jgi:hypothetical protein